MAKQHYMALVQSNLSSYNVALKFAKQKLTL